MIFWHGAGKQNLSNEAYRIEPAKYYAKAQNMVDQYTVRQEGATPVVHPPPGSDVYLVARLWSWWPILELEKGQSYRMHLSSMDWQHGFSLQPVNINLQVHPGYDIVFSMIPTDTGDFGVICNEFCGIGHHNMIGKIIVVE
jgi:cytochrome c oxidase subunit 2